MLHLHHGFPPAVAGAPQFFPLVEDELVHGVLEHTGQVIGGGELGTLAVVAAGEFNITRHEGVKLADAAEFGRLDLFGALRAGGTQQVVQGCADVLVGADHLADAPAALDHSGGSEVAHQLAGFADGGFEFSGVEDAPAKALAQFGLQARAGIAPHSGMLSSRLAYTSSGEGCSSGLTGWAVTAWVADCSFSSCMVLFSFVSIGLDDGLVKGGRFLRAPGR